MTAFERLHELLRESAVEHWVGTKADGGKVSLSPAQLSMLDSCRMIIKSVKLVKWLLQTYILPSVFPVRFNILLE